jgi:hypothetical protein
VTARPLLECTFLIPVRRDRNEADGGRHGRKAWDWLENGLLEFEGATRDSGLKKGWYIDQVTGGRVHDQSCCYTVALPRKRVDRLRALLGEACWVFGQKCIYLSVAGRVEFVEKIER